MVAVRLEQILRILELTDSLNIHREAVIIPLNAEKEGDLTLLPDGRLRIHCPETRFEEWLIEIRGQLEKIDLSRIVRH